MNRTFTLIALVLALSGCGVGEIAATGATQAAGKAEEMKQAQKTQEKIEQRLDDANRAAAEQRQAAEEASQ